MVCWPSLPATFFESNSISDPVPFSLKPFPHPETDTHVFNQHRLLASPYGWGSDQHTAELIEYLLRSWPWDKECSELTGTPDWLAAEGPVMKNQDVLSPWLNEIRYPWAVMGRHWEYWVLFPKLSSGFESRQLSPRGSLRPHWDMLIVSALIKSENSATPEQNNHICPFMEPSTAFLLSGKDGIGLLVVSPSLEYVYADSLEQKAHVFTQHWAYSSAQETVFQYLTIWPSAIDPVLLKWELEGPKQWLSTGQDLTSFWNWSFLLYFHRTMCSDFHSGSWVKHDIGKKLPDLERQCGLEREAGIWDAMPVPVLSAFALALWN